MVTDSAGCAAASASTPVVVAYPPGAATATPSATASWPRIGRTVVGAGFTRAACAAPADVRPSQLRFASAAPNGWVGRSPVGW